MAYARGHAANIGPRERRKRYLIGGGLLVLSLGLTVLYHALDVAVWWHISLFFPLWGAMLGLFQAREHT